jgi:acyl-CoA reductase-like NAD-dependent aldehyde dehydrogenase
LSATTSVSPGSPPLDEDRSAPAEDGLDAAVAMVRANAASWAATDNAERIRLIDAVRRDLASVADSWAAAAIAAEGLDPRAPASGEEALVGPYIVLRYLRSLREALVDIERHGAPRIAGALRTRPDGQVTARVFPASIYDRLFYPFITADVWMEPGIGQSEVAGTQAVAYRAHPHGSGRVCVVLGAGNTSSIGPMDIAGKLFVENQAVLFKPHPAIGWLDPFLRVGLRALIDRGVLRIVSGEADVGAQLCRHPAVDSVHVTGTQATFDAIVFGRGPDGEANKAAWGERQPSKPVTAELGNISPVIVVPGRWSSAEIASQAENIASTLTNNAGFNCNATRVIVTHAGWPQREQLMASLREQLRREPPRVAFYPGAAERFDTFIAAHPEATQLGPRSDERLPWAIVENVDPQARDDICFTTEAFCSVFAETAIPAPSVAEFLDKAVDFANETLVGTLNATVIVKPATARERSIASALDRAVTNLRYGTVSVNGWAGLGYGLSTLPWGAFPEASPGQPGSGTGAVHNALMFDRAQKSVIRAPFKPPIKPAWYRSHRTVHRLAPRLVRFEASPSPWAVPAIAALALRG